MRPTDCPDHQCTDFYDCVECIAETAKALERAKNTDWSAMAHALKKQLLAIDQSPEMKEHIAMICEIGDAYDAHRLGIKHEQRPESAMESREDQ